MEIIFRKYGSIIGAVIGIIFAVVLITVVYGLVKTESVNQTNNLASFVDEALDSASASQ